MLGHFRFLLALLVIVYHFGAKPFCRQWGVYAVFGFYVISGYLMTLVLASRATASASAAALRYLANRALRLFPPYLCVVAVALLLLERWGTRVTRFHEAMQIPATTGQWLGNLLIVPFVGDCPVPLDSARLVVGGRDGLSISALARHRSLALDGLARSADFARHHRPSRLSKRPTSARRYYTVSASALPFCVGASIFFVKDALRRPAARTRVGGHAGPIHRQRCLGPDSAGPMCFFGRSTSTSRWRR